MLGLGRERSTLWTLEPRQPFVHDQCHLLCFSRIMTPNKVLLADYSRSHRISVHICTALGLHVWYTVSSQSKASTIADRWLHFSLPHRVESGEHCGPTGIEHWVARFWKGSVRRKVLQICNWWCACFNTLRLLWFNLEQRCPVSLHSVRSRIYQLKSWTL